MIKLLVRMFRAVKPLRKPIWVRFGRYDDWLAAESVNGIYHAIWWTDDFPLRLNDDGTATIMERGLCGTGKPYPNFEWKPRTKGDAK